VTCRVRMSVAQQGALEQQGLDEPGLELEPDEKVLMRAWDGQRVLEFPERDRDRVWSAINDRSNAEDAQAIEDRRNGHREVAKFASRASRSLAALGGKVLKARCK
jgi:hypothetical protein